ncbi:MAG TPA: hypothetical protein VM912_06935, partial [Terriglobales bacterium]|nr:hypothetical protein [Terriglobales bacterium]
MAAPRCNRSFFLAFLCCCATLWAHSQDTGRAVRHHPAAVAETSEASALLDKAEALLAKSDYAGAKPILQQA